MSAAGGGDGHCPALGALAETGALTCVMTFVLRMADYEVVVDDRTAPVCS